MSKRLIMTIGMVLAISAGLATVAMAGVPFLVKDLLATIAGEPTSGGNHRCDCSRKAGIN